MLIHVRNELSTWGGGGASKSQPQQLCGNWKPQNNMTQMKCYGRKAKKLHGSQGLCPVTKNFTARREG